MTGGAALAIHIVGIGGTGMSAIARLLVARGHHVSGSDDGPWPLSEALVPLGVRVARQFSPANVTGAEIVLRSSAYGEDHVEVAAARAARIPVWRRHEAWAALAADRRVLAVAGTHGKTTTTALAWSALRAGGSDASLICGAPLRSIGTNAHAGTSDVLVIEADEYDLTFLALSPFVGLVTNVEHDHVDQFPTEGDVRTAFAAFAARSETIVACADDPGAAALRGSSRTRRYGTSAGADLRVGGIEPTEGAGIAFTASIAASAIPVALQVPGRHNALNAAGALLAAIDFGIEPIAAARGLAGFSGTARRLETLGSAAGVMVIDDYAHHPTEIRASIAATRSRTPGRLIAVFQPHMESRTAAFRDAFVASLEDADIRIVVATFPSAREASDGGAGARDLAARSGAAFAADPSDAARLVAAQAHSGDVVLVMGAGDIRAAGERLLESLRRG